MKNSKNTSTSETVPVFRRQEVASIIIDRYEISARRDGVLMLSGFQHIPEVGFVEQSRQIITNEHAKSLISAISTTLEKINKEVGDAPKNTKKAKPKQALPSSEK